MLILLRVKNDLTILVKIKEREDSNGNCKHETIK